ncbi:MAG: NAD(P)/FAD-dependent oxidoreductase [Candidatus Azotimanducaceae bacterium]
MNNQSKSSQFSEDYKETSYWLDDISASDSKNNHSPELPEQTDLVIIGSGYTGLNAAIETAAQGVETLVIDQGDLGQGCSTKNGGQISTSIKPSLKALSKKYGGEKANAIRQEGLNALNWIEDFITLENLNCEFTKSGRFHGAHTPRQYEQMCATVNGLGQENITAHPVKKSAMSSELGTDFYHGGLVFPDNASLHPAKYHRELIGLAGARGSKLIGNCKALNISRDKGCFVISTSKGEVVAKKLAVATNGYTSSLTPWLKRRIIPIGSYIIATEPLDAELMDRLFPTNRMITDSRKVVFYFRPSPDRTRILFGGRVSARETDPSKSGPKLLKDLARLFPELTQTKISHSWTGTVAYSFDELAHTGMQNGMHYAMSYCGSGVSMASYLGMKMGRKIAEVSDSQTAFDELQYPSRPYYFGNPWFLPLAVEWYRMTDRILY